MLSVVSLFAQSNDPYLQLVSADSLVDISTGGDEIFELWGNVEMSQGDALLFCSQAKWYKNSRNITLDNEVMIYDGERTLVADHVFYDGKRRTEEARGNVILTEERKALFCDQLDYNQNTRIAVAREGIFFKDFLENRVLTCDSLLWNRNEKYVAAALSPTIIQVDSVTQDTLSIAGMLIEVWEESQHARITENVSLARGIMSARCALADYYSDRSDLLLKLDPSIDYENHTMEGDSIYINLTDMKFQGGTLLGEPVIITRDSTVENRLSGREIIIEARDDTLLKIRVEGQATSLYHFHEDDEQPGLNKVTGDLITVLFEDNKVEKVLAASNPGQSTGNYKPENSKEKPRTRQAVEEK